jgi:5-methylcytosine-specific restriction endonuclease McrA
MTARLRQLDPQRLTKPIKERMDTSTFKFAKPPQKAPEQPKDGRLKESPYQYSKTKRAIWERQGRKCFECGDFLPSPAFGDRHHIGGRGLGGGKRDDAKTVVLCREKCHKKYDPKPEWSGGKSA